MDCINKNEIQNIYKKKCNYVYQNIKLYINFIMACEGVSSFKGFKEACKHEKGTSTVYFLLWNKQLVSFIYKLFICYIFIKYYYILYSLMFFFCSAWIEESHIKPYQEYKDTLVKSSKSGAFKDAVEAIEDFIAKGEVSSKFIYLYLII